MRYNETMGTLQKARICASCGEPITDALYLMEPDGSARCEPCYFRKTYLSGIVKRIEVSYLATIEAFVSAIDAREHETGRHSLRVTQFAVIIGHAFGIQDRDLVDLYCGALLHDIGKIGVPDAVLLKRGPLSKDEQDMMQKHPEIGHRIISHIGYLANASRIIICHHEHVDGSGYPKGLKGDEIPLGARVFAVADTLDALTVKRPYREPISFEDACGEIKAKTGNIYDPLAVKALEDAAGDLKDIIGKIVFEEDHLPHEHHRLI